jgi:hypothetical protein
MVENRASLDCSVNIDEDNVVSRELEGETVILDLKTGTYFGLNPIGTRIWALIQEYRSLRRVYEEMQKEYEVSSKTLETDLLELVDQLSAKGLVSLGATDERR